MNRSLMLFLIFIISLTFSKAIEVDITAGPPAYDKAWVPAWGFFVGYNTSWRDRHLELLNQTQENGKNIKVVFLGDSLTDNFPTIGKEIWIRYYANQGVYNYGVGGDSTREVLWRIQHGELDGMSPKLLTLMIGTNNLNDENAWNPWDRATDEEIVKAIRLILDELRKKLANTTILLLSILPEGSDKTNQRIRNINSQISKFKDNKVIYYLDLYQYFVDSVGKQQSNLFMADTVHPNENGYLAWARAMQPTYYALLNDQL